MVMDQVMEALVPAAPGSAAVEQPDSLVPAGKKKGKKEKAPRVPVQRSKFATVSTPVNGEQRRKELGKVYEGRRKLKQTAVAKAKASASAAGGLPPRSPLKDQLGKKFTTVGEVLRDAQQLVVDEQVRLEHAGRGHVVDFEERKDFLLVLQDRLFQILAADDEDHGPGITTEPKIKVEQRGG